MSDSLAHYGVLGMKWGVRKDGKPQGFQYGYGGGSRGDHEDVFVDIPHTSNDAYRRVRSRELSARLEELRDTDPYKTWHKNRDRAWDSHKKTDENYKRTMREAKKADDEAMQDGRDPRFQGYEQYWADRNLRWKFNQSYEKMHRAPKEVVEYRSIEKALLYRKSRNMLISMATIPIGITVLSAYLATRKKSTPLYEY